MRRTFRTDGRFYGKNFRSIFIYSDIRSGTAFWSNLDGLAIPDRLNQFELATFAWNFYDWFSRDTSQWEKES